MNSPKLPSPALRRVLCIGGGPAGLYFALLMKARWPDLAVTVVERNRPFDTFGWGVVLSDQTLANLAAADAPTAALIGDAFNHWDDIEVFFKGRSVRSGGHGFCGIGRKRLLNILQQRCEELGVELVFETDVADDQALAARYQADLVIASDGLNSRIRARYEPTYRPMIEARQCRFVWLGTTRKFDAFTFDFQETEHGWFQAHIYQYDGETSTFIVETPEVELSRPVRLIHPRWPLYVIPRGDNRFMLGATSIEAEDTGVSVRSALELLGAAYAVHPAFAEARILEFGSGLRPAYPDNLPRITVEKKKIAVNGLYRHGFLLAPALAELTLAHVQRGAIDNEVMRCV